jgi:hypothetical protein
MTVERDIGGTKNTILESKDGHETKPKWICNGEKKNTTDRSSIGAEQQRKEKPAEQDSEP